MSLLSIHTALQEAIMQLSRHVHTPTCLARQEAICWQRCLWHRAQTCQFYTTSLGPPFLIMQEEYSVGAPSYLQHIAQPPRDRFSLRPQRWRTRYNLLLEEKTINTLQLTNWQLLVLPLPPVQTAPRPLRHEVPGAWHFFGRLLRTGCINSDW